MIIKMKKKQKPTREEREVKEKREVKKENKLPLMEPFSFTFNAIKLKTKKLL